MEFKKIAASSVSQYFPVNEGEEEIAEIVTKAKKELADALSSFMLKVTNTIRPAITKLLQGKQLGKISISDPVEKPVSSEPINNSLGSEPAANDLIGGSSDEPESSEDELKTGVAPPAKRGRPRKNPLTPEQQAALDDAGVKTKETEVNALKVKMAEKHLGGVYDIVKNATTLNGGFDMNKWFRWPTPKIKKSIPSLVDYQKEINQKAYRVTTDSLDDLIELAAFVATQGVNPRTCRTYLLKLTNDRLADTETGNLSDKIQEIAGIPEREAEQKIVDKFQEISPHVKQIDLNIPKPKPEEKEPLVQATNDIEPEMKAQEVQPVQDKEPDVVAAAIEPEQANGPEVVAEPEQTSEPTKESPANPLAVDLDDFIASTGLG